MAERVCAEDSPPTPSEQSDQSPLGNPSESDTVTPETKDEIRERVHLRMLNNVDVYAIAEKYDLPELKALAIEKFRQDAHTWPLKDLAAIGHEVYESTSSSDRGLRDVVTWICEGHIDYFMEDEKLGKVFEGFGFDVFKVAMEKYRNSLNVIADLNFEIAARKLDVSNLSKENAELRGKTESATYKLNITQTQIDRATNQIMSGSPCQMCGNAMDGKLQLKGAIESLKLILSCEHCSGYLDLGTCWWTRAGK